MIELNDVRCVRWGGPAVIVLALAAVLSSDTLVPWRFGCAAAVALLGTLSWWRYRRLRPLSLESAPANGMVCRRADGARFSVTAVRSGVVTASLVSARLLGAGDERADLFVPACALEADAHWRLRRLLNGFRPPDQSTTNDRSADR